MMFAHIYLGLTAAYVILQPINYMVQNVMAVKPKTKQAFGHVQETVQWLRVLFALLKDLEG